MSRPYKRLRILMLEHEYSQTAIARVLLRSPRYVSARLNNHAPWELNDCYKILKLFGMASDTLTELFPENGVGEPGVRKR